MQNPSEKKSNMFPKISVLYLIWLIWMCFMGIVDAKDCNEYTDCNSCSQATVTLGWFFTFDCLWCPLDRECHTSGSLMTPCLSSMNVNDQAQCPAEDYGTYNKETAYRATLLSAAAYYGNPQQCLNSIAAPDGFVVEDIILVQCDDFYFDYEACVAFVGISSTTQEVSVVFRGTKRPVQLVDQILSILGTPDVDSDIGGKVQAYFDNIYTKMYPCVRASVQSLLQQYPGYNVLVTGHSLGGAIASQTASSLVHDGTVAKSKMHLYTLGMPRVGDKNYAYNHDKVLSSSWNVVNFRDIVPHTPFCNLITGCNYPSNMPFQHRTEVYYASMTNGKDSAYVICNENEDQDCSNGAVTDDPCAFDLHECIDYHVNYFGIAVGDTCNSALGRVTPSWKGIAVSPSKCKSVDA